MASVVYPQAPGTEGGPCAEPCEHKGCQVSRLDSQKVCRICLQEIGYERRTYTEYTDPADLNKYRLIHATCLEAEVEKERSNKRSFKIGDRVEILVDNNWLPGRIIGTASAVLAYAWHVQLDDRSSALSYVMVKRERENVTMRHCDLPMPERKAMSRRQETSGRTETEAAAVSVTDEPKFKVGDRVELFAPSDAPNTPLWRCEGDQVWHSGHIVEHIRVSRRDSLLVHLDASKRATKTIAVSTGEADKFLRHLTADRRLDFLTKEAERLDALIEKTMRERTAIVEQLAALTPVVATSTIPSDLTPAEKGILASRRDLDLYGDPDSFVDEQGA